MSEKEFKAIVLSETHWDRAWYLPFQVYRVRLVRLVDRLLKLLDEKHDFHSFMLDGQMAPIEDYLAIRPKAFADLKRHVEAGRLFVGPWYILADEYLVSPEALIRNLQLGLKMAAEYGSIMREGYTPDSFGHISQLPQILRGFDIESVIFWRGFGDEADTLGNEFYWDAPDGSRVLAVHIRDGYHNIANVGYPNRGSDRSAMQLDMELALDQMKAAVELLKPHAQTSQLLLFDGVDHAEANTDITAIIAAANKVLTDTEVIHGTLPDYIANVRAELNGRELPSIAGEFNRGKYAHVLQSVYSTRIYLKQANERMQRLLESYVEPVASWAWLLGAHYPQALLQEAWRLLLLNHPHDDICGCSCDEVHQEDMQRFSEVDQIGRILLRDSFRELMNNVKRDHQSGIPIVVFNSAGWGWSGSAEITIPFDQNAPQTPFQLVDAAGNLVPYQLLRHSDYFEAELRKNHYQRRVTIAAQLDDLPAHGITVLYCQPVEATPEFAPRVRSVPNGMENEHLSVRINFDGTFSLLDKATDRHYSDLGYFIDEEDAGDEYDYSPCPNPQRFSTRGLSPAIRLVDDGGEQVSYAIRYGWEIPQKLSDDRQHRSRDLVSVSIETLLTLRGNSRVLEIKTTIDNNALDHRLRACFPTDLATDDATADGHFDMLTRPIVPAHKPDWVQSPVPTRHQRTFVDVSDGTAGLAVLNRGLPEYEVMPDGGRNTVALTLLRCVDMLFRDDLLTRPGYAWLPLHTPDAQCQGKHTFEYALAPHAGDWRDVYAAAQTWRLPLHVRRGDEREGFVPHEAVPKEKEAYQLFKDTVVRPLDFGGAIEDGTSLLTVGPSSVALSAVKRSEDGEMLVVRVVNMGDETASAEITPFLSFNKAWQLNFNEEKQRVLTDTPNGNTLTISIKSREAFTIGFDIQQKQYPTLETKG